MLRESGLAEETTNGNAQSEILSALHMIGCFEDSNM